MISKHAGSRLVQLARIGAVSLLMHAGVCGAQATDASAPQPGAAAPGAAPAAPAGAALAAPPAAANCAANDQPAARKEAFDFVRARFRVRDQFQRITVLLASDNAEGAMKSGAYARDDDEIMLVSRRQDAFVTEARAAVARTALPDFSRLQLERGDRVMQVHVLARAEDLEWLACSRRVFRIEPRRIPAAAG